MSFVALNEEGYFLNKDGEPFYLVGINFSPYYPEGCFWKENWNPESLVRDLDKMKEMGLNCIRFPVHWYVFEPEEGQMDLEMLKRLDWFVDHCKERDLYMHPWFLVGLASGQFDIPWRNGRSVFFDESMICAEEKHLAFFAEHYKDEEYILAWDICDEPEGFDSPWLNYACGQHLPYDREKIAYWLRRMYHAFKDHDPNHIVTLGVSDFITHKYGMDARDFADILDIMSITCYTEEMDEGVDRARPGLWFDWVADMERFGASVFCAEAPGDSSVAHFDEEICGLYESVIFGTWLHGSVGTLPWRLQWYPIETLTQGFVDEFVLGSGFGIMKGDGTLKPQGETLCRVARVMKQINAPQYKLRKPKAALLIPNGYHVQVEKAYPQLRTAYAALVGGDVPVETVWITEEYEKYDYLIVASTCSENWTKDFHASDYARLLKYVENGGKLLYLWNRGQVNAPFFEELFGARIGCTCGLWENNELVFTEAIGGFHAGDTMIMDESATHYRRMKATTATVLATVDEGCPCILHNKVGKGEAIYVGTELFGSLYKLSPKQWESSPLFGLIGALLERMGLVRPVICEDPSVECGIMESALADQYLVLLVNRNNKACEKSAFIKGMTDYIPVNEEGEVLEYQVHESGLEIKGPFEERRATMIILKKKDNM